jgi:hypothetical protein
MLDEHVELLERALVEQKLDAFPRRQLAARVLRLNAFLAAAELCGGTASIESFENILHDLPPALRPASSMPLSLSPTGAVRTTPKSDSTALNHSGLILLMEHDLIRKPVSAF